VTAIISSQDNSYEQVRMTRIGSQRSNENSEELATMDMPLLWRVWRKNGR